MKKLILIFLIACSGSTLSYSQMNNSIKPMDFYLKKRSQNITFSGSGGASLFMDKNPEFRSAMINSLTYERFIFDRVAIQSGFSVYSKMGSNVNSRGFMAVAIPVSIKYYPKLQLYNNTFHIDLGFVAGFKRSDANSMLFDNKNFRINPTIEIGGVWIPQKMFGKINNHWSFDYGLTQTITSLKKLSLPGAYFGITFTF